MMKSANPTLSYVTAFPRWRGTNPGTSHALDSYGAIVPGACTNRVSAGMPSWKQQLDRKPVAGRDALGSLGRPASFLSSPPIPNRNSKHIFEVSVQR